VEISTRLLLNSLYFPMKMPRQLLWLARAVVSVMFLAIALYASYQIVKFTWQETTEDHP
jgi:hypothetical protein